jgi:hypothetical protein
MLGQVCTERITPFVRAKLIVLDILAEPEFARHQVKRGWSFGAASFLSVSRPCIIDQYLRECSRYCTKEVSSILPRKFYTTLLV